VRDVHNRRRQIIITSYSAPFSTLFVVAVVDRYRLGVASARATNITAAASGNHGIWHYYYITTLCCVLVPLYTYTCMYVCGRAGVYNIISCYLSLAVAALAHYFGRECLRTASVCERHVRRPPRSYCSY